MGNLLPGQLDSLLEAHRLTLKAIGMILGMPMMEEAVYDRWDVCLVGLTMLKGSPNQERR